MYFEVYGHFELPVRDYKVDASSLKAFWEEVDATDKELRKGIGVYVFSRRHGSVFKPWYVGMTSARTGFHGEIFQPHKLDHYNAVLETGRGAGVMHLIPCFTDSMRFSKGYSSARPEILFVERALIGFAYRANPNFRNKRDTKFLEECVVRGLMGSTAPGRVPASSAELRGALKLK